MLVNVLLSWLASMKLSTARGTCKKEEGIERIVKRVVFSDDFLFL